ncbi:transcriptional regulator [Pseudomonas sp. CC120222-01a]|uniref:transcriptional regulator n=1 Tax=Pseudomonas sp. CC120222-01a TaxID=1378075 RepID=UPI001057DDDB|nr:transcriptional regulator [Pseudomonas sp. CC120222-01a]
MTPNLIPFDMANLLDCEEAIEEYLMQVMIDGDSAELARARLHIDRARARNAVISPVAVSSAPTLPACHPEPAAPQCRRNPPDFKC